MKDEECSAFFEFVRNVFHRFNPRKQKCVRGSSIPSMNKILSKEIMKRSKLGNYSGVNENRKIYTKQPFLCVLTKTKTKRS